MGDLSFFLKAQAPNAPRGPGPAGCEWDSGFYGSRVRTVAGCLGLEAASSFGVQGTLNPKP